MVKNLFATLMFLLCTATAGASVDSDTLTVRIKAMRCGECSHKVMLAVRQLPGIESVRSNLERRTTTVVYDPALTSVDSIKARLVATKRFKPSAYSPNDTILRGFGLRMDDMATPEQTDRIASRLQQMVGIDSVAPHLDKHYYFIRYDANRTCKADIRRELLTMGFTPVNYYTGNKIAFAFYHIPVDQATTQSLETVLVIDGVEDVNINAQKGTMAVTYFNDTTDADRLLETIRRAGLDANPVE